MKRLIIIFLLFFIIVPKITYAKESTSTIVMDYNSGRILYENNAYDQKLIASITKVMTCIIVLENNDLNTSIEVGEEILQSYGTNIYIEVGEIITIKDLLFGLMLRSGNDAAITLATNTIGEEMFVKKMNEKAREIGMNNTIFENPHGLDDNTRNTSTAYDMALLAKYAYKNETFRNIISTKKYIAQSNFKTYEWYNRMSLLTKYKYCVGGKNGYTPRAGKTLISYANKEGKTFIIVSLNDNNIYDNHKILFEKIFSTYNYYTILDHNSFSLNSSLINSNLYIKDSFLYPLKKDEISKVSTIVEISKSSNYEKGKIKILLENKLIGEVNVYSKPQKKEDENIFQKFINLFT